MSDRWEQEVTVELDGEVRLIASTMDAADVCLPVWPTGRDPNTIRRCKVLLTSLMGVSRRRLHALHSSRL